MPTTQQLWEQQQQQEQQAQGMMVNSGAIVSYNGSPAKEDIGKDQELSRSVLAAFQAKEEEIERRKIQMKEKVQAQLGRVEEETKRLAEIREELDALQDPMRKEVALVRKRIDTINKELRPLGMNCQKKEKEYKDALDSFNEKSREKAQWVAKLMELVAESEKLRLKKLEELTKNIESLR